MPLYPPGGKTAIGTKGLSDAAAALPTPLPAIPPDRTPETDGAAPRPVSGNPVTAGPVSPDGAAADQPGGTDSAPMEPALPIVADTGVSPPTNPPIPNGPRPGNSLFAAE